jgi:hypothetical protein
MAEKIIVCLDGMWNRQEQDAKFASRPNNVFMIADAVDLGDPAQRVFHLNCVGTKWGLKIRGGALDYGLFEQIKQGYGRNRSTAPASAQRSGSDRRRQRRRLY